MKNKRFFKATDTLLVIMMILPWVAGIIIKVLTEQPSEGISVKGARIFFTISMPIGELPITESQLNSVLVITFVFALCLYLTHGIKTVPDSKRQLIAELIIKKAEALVLDNMGKAFLDFTPFICTILALSAFSTLSSLLGLYPPTSDINIVGGWAILVFLLITYYKMKGGFVNYLKSFTKPVAILTPFNIISEFSTPISMAFRHYGNVLAGLIILTLLGAGLEGLSSLIFAGLPAALENIPFLRIGIPAVLSIYFDVFSALLQAFIFAMLTMLYVANGSADLTKTQKIQ